MAKRHRDKTMKNERGDVLTWVVEGNKVKECNLYFVASHTHEGWDKNVKIRGHFLDKKTAVEVLLKNA